MSQPAVSSVVHEFDALKSLKSCALITDYDQQLFVVEQDNETHRAEKVSRVININAPSHHANHSFNDGAVLVLTQAAAKTCIAIPDFCSGLEVLDVLRVENLRIKTLVPVFGEGGIAVNAIEVDLSPRLAYNHRLSGYFIINQFLSGGGMSGGIIIDKFGKIAGIICGGGKVDFEIENTAKAIDLMLSWSDELDFSWEHIEDNSLAPGRKKAKIFLNNVLFVKWISKSEFEQCRMQIQNNEAERS